MMLKVVNNAPIKTEDEDIKKMILGLAKLKSSKSKLSNVDLIKLDIIKNETMQFFMDLLETKNVVVSGIFEDYVLMFELDQVFNGIFYTPVAVVEEGGQMYLQVEEEL